MASTLRAPSSTSGTGSTSYPPSSTAPTMVGTYNAICSAGGSGTNYMPGNQSAAFSIAAWTLTGFYQPVTMGGIYNTVKGGSTVPLKFNVYQGAQGVNERTDVAAISFAVTQGACSAGTMEDPLDFVTTGGTALRYDIWWSPLHPELADAEARERVLPGHDDDAGRQQPGGLLQDEVATAPGRRWFDHRAR